MTDSLVVPNVAPLMWFFKVKDVCARKVRVSLFHSLLALGNYGSQKNRKDLMLSWWWFEDDEKKMTE